MKEEWRSIKKYEGLYEVSNHGKVRSIERHDSLGRLNKGKLLCPSSSRKYKHVALSKDGTPKHFLVHRLVAIAFIENPFNYGCVNHKNENSHDNRVENLEWCTHKYNNNYGTGHIRTAHTKGTHTLQKTVEGCIVGDFYSVSEASRQTGFSSTAIWNGIQYNKITNGYLWKAARKENVYA